jgi:hypothetical protein
MAYAVLKQPPRAPANAAPSGLSTGFDWTGIWKDGLQKIEERFNNSWGIIMDRLLRKRTHVINQICLPISIHDIQLSAKPQPGSVYPPTRQAVPPLFT